MLNKKNKSLEKEIDNYIGSDPLLKKRDKDKFDEWLQQSSKSKRNKQLIPGIITIILLIGFSGLIYTIIDVENSNKTIEELTSNYPDDVKAKIKELPETIQEKLSFPTEFPSTPKYVGFSYESVPFNDPNGNIISVLFTFGDENANWKAHINMRFGNVEIYHETSQDLVILDNGLEAKILDGEDFKDISWFDENNIYYNISFLDIEHQYTIDDVVAIANSIQ